MLKKYMAAGAVAVTLVGAAGAAYAGKDLDAIKARGNLICGVTTGVAGFSWRKHWITLHERQLFGPLPFLPAVFGADFCASLTASTARKRSVKCSASMSASMRNDTGARKRRST